MIDDVDQAVHQPIRRHRRPGAAPSRRLIDGIDELTRALTSPTPVLPDAVAEMLCRLVETVPGARWATLLRRSEPGRRPTTAAATDAVAAELDALQCAAGQGPCWDALDAREPVVVDDLGGELRWPGFAARAVEQTPARAVFSVPIAGGGEGAGALNLYADRPHAFPAASALDGAACFAAAVSGLALAALEHRAKADNLTVALATSRRISAAVGVLMGRHGWTYDHAFDALRVASQLLHRKLRDIADEVVLTGAMPAAARLGSG